jgi:hypothetical protein
LRDADHKLFAFSSEAFCLLFAMGKSSMLPWLTLMSTMMGCRGAMPMATIQKKKKKEIKQKVPPIATTAATADQQTSGSIQPQVSFVPNAEADRVEIEVENAFRLSSSVSLSFFGSLADFRRLGELFGSSKF